MQVFPLKWKLEINLRYGEVSLLAVDCSQPFHILKVNAGVVVEYFSPTGSMQNRF